MTRESNDGAMTDKSNDRAMTGESVSEEWILLDSQLTVYDFCNRKLLQNIRRSKIPCRIR